MHNWIQSCKKDPIWANKLYKDDMKIIQLFRRFSPYSSNIFKIKHLLKLMPLNNLFVLYSEEKKIMYFYKTITVPIGLQLIECENVL